MNETLTFAIPTLFGLESLAADELRRLDLPQVRAENGRVLCSGTLGDIPRLNVNLRTGERVLLVLGTFPAGDFDALFEGTRTLPWERFIPRDGQFPVKGHSLNSALHSIPACQAIVKKAVAARLGAQYGMNTLPETGALYQIQFSIMKDTAVLMLDTSGAGLHKRGYRAQGVAAPLRETLAAAMVLLSRYRGRDPLCDPFCGSGTIPIEAALIAKNRAPGLNRSFSAQKWACVDRELWLRAADEAMDKEFDGDYEIWGGDLDPAAVDLARRNAELAEVDDIVSATLDELGVKWQMPAPSTGAECMAGSSPIPPTASGSWSAGRRRSCTVPLERHGPSSRRPGSCICCPPTRSSSAPLGRRRTRSASYIMVCSSVTCSCTWGKKSWGGGDPAPDCVLPGRRAVEISTWRFCL